MSAGDQDRDVDYLRTVQYRDSSQLAKRASLHVRYRTAPVAAFDMFASLIAWPAGGRVLDVGTGAGGLWEHVAAVAPDGLRLVLSDLSAGMVDEAVDRARATGRFASVEGRVCDARDLPFSDAVFDVAVSTYALYHVPEPAKAVAELARVVAPDGTVGIMTNGPGHLREIEAIRVEVFGEVGRYTVNRSFTPGDAAMMLIDHFGEVCWHRYDDALRVTNVDHVLDFITSSPPANSATPEQQRQLHDLVLCSTTDGVFHVSKDTGCLVCRRKVST
jgi:ubiquinone/menaquinone biosynthesis C-methylase UbiE